MTIRISSTAFGKSYSKIHVAQIESFDEDSFVTYFYCWYDVRTYERFFIDDIEDYDSIEEDNDDVNGFFVCFAIDEIDNIKSLLCL